MASKTSFAQIDPNIWDDPWFIDLPSDSHRLLFIWLFTNRHKNCTGIYEIHKRTICAGFSPELVDEALAIFAESGRIYYEEGYIIIANWMKRTHYNTPEVRTYAINHINSLPSSIKERHGDIIDVILDRAGQGGGQDPAQGGGQGRGQGGNMKYEIGNKKYEIRKKDALSTPPVKTETATFTKADKADDELWETKGYGNIAEAVGVKDKMWVRVSWIENIQSTYPNTYKDAVKKALRKQAEEGRQMANPEGYIEAILVNKNGGKYNGKNK